MTPTHRLVADLLDAVDSAEGDHIRFPKTDAIRIAELLVRAQFVGEAPSYSYLSAAACSPFRISFTSSSGAVIIEL